MRLYKSNEFCEDMNCKSLCGKNKDVCIHNGNPNRCKFTAKEFHEWLEENEFEIRKRTPNKYRCIYCHKKLPRIESHICKGVMRIHNLKFRKLNSGTLHTLRIDKK